MHIGESLSVSVSSIRSNVLRSSLTLLGVVIGVMTIIATMSIIKGLQNMINSEMQSLSAGVFQVQKYEVQVGDGGHRRREFRPDLGSKEVRAIEENVPLAAVVAEEIWSWNNTVKYQNEATNPNIRVAGGVPGFVFNNGQNIERGRDITEQDVQFARPVCILGRKVVDKLFPYRDPIGDYIFINGQRALVVGILEEKGSMFGNDSYSSFVLVPIRTFVNWWGSERSWNITVRIHDPERIEEAIEQTIAAVRVARGLKPGEENNFGIFYSNQIVDTFNDMTKWIRFAAFGIASISLLVAGVGIMNIMLVAVTERTREIGIRKALGARRSSIMGQFLMEAVILTEIGALVGVGIGVGAAYLLGNAVDLPIAIPIWTIVTGIVFCSAVGLLFGTWPAWKASRLDPIVALRYE